jgi:hypothetical protein
VMIFSEGLIAPRKISSLREISPNPPSGRSINDILYPKVKELTKFRIQFLISYVYLSF